MRGLIGISKKWLYMGKETSQRRKILTKSSFKAKKRKKYYTRNLRLSMSSFKNKPLVVFNWSLKSMKYFLHRYSNCDQGERIIRIYSFVKEYNHKDHTWQFINFNKIFVSHYFSYCFAYIARLHKICSYIEL